MVPVALTNDKAGRFIPTGNMNFPREFGPMFGFEGINGHVIVRDERKVEPAIKYLQDEGWTINRK